MPRKYSRRQRSSQKAKKSTKNTLRVWRRVVCALRDVLQQSAVKTSRGADSVYLFFVFTGGSSTRGAWIIRRFLKGGECLRVRGRVQRAHTRKVEHGV